MKACCEPLTTNPVISVGISDNSFQKYYYTENTFYATKKLFVADKAGQIIAQFEPNIFVKFVIRNNFFDVYVEEKKILEGLSSPLILKTETDGFIGIQNLKRAGLPALYRGQIQLKKPNNKENLFLTNNVLLLEQYLLGVVPNEMPVKFGLEALKAQAVAARNYALRPRDKKYHEFDVCDSVACQVYFGANTEKPLGSQAVEETRGVVAQYKDELILALYSSTAGGYTESYENAFLMTKPEFPYLKAVSDNEDFEDLGKEEKAKEFYSSKPKTYDNESPYFRWEKEWTKEELEKVIKDGLMSAYNAGFCFPEPKQEDIGSLKEIKVKKRGKSGKIVSLEIITDKKTFVVEKELVIRRLFKNKGKALPSANVVFEHEYDQEGTLLAVKAYGGGYGHGVGMSQHGAGFMSKNGKTYDEILQHYYTGTELTLIPFELSSEPNKNSAVYDFYLTQKKAKIIVENKFAYNELKVVINGKEFNLKTQPSLSRKYEVDISQYVNLGDNKVYFFYPLDNNKTIKVYISLYGTIDDK